MTERAFEGRAAESLENETLRSANQQTCSYGYDDLTRVASANCGTVWNETFTLDPLGNIDKNAISGALNFLPTYSETTNQYSSIPGVTGPYYDSNGNVIKDGFHSYTWDAEGLPHSVDNLLFTYDALGRAVEDSGGTQLVYSPQGGRLGFMSGQTFQTGRVPLVAGAWARYLASGLFLYRHPDWLGSVRLSSTTSRGVYYDGAYAPYGESYAEWGTTDHVFTGQKEDTVGDLYDFPFREYHASQGRWLSPDPAGLAAADLANPQSLNRYAYVANNPLAFTDPQGLQGCPPGATQGPGQGQCSGNTLEITSLEYGWDLIAGFGMEAEFGLMELGTTPGGPSVTYTYQYSAAQSSTTAQVYDDYGYYWELPYLVAPPTVTLVGAIFTSSDLGIVFTTTGPTTASFVSTYSFNQTVQKFKQAGFVQYPQDYVDFFHPGQLDLRDTLPFCSAHVDVYKTSGQDGLPTNGNVHLDSINPWAPSPVPSVNGGAGLIQPLGHLSLDVFRLYPGSTACSW